jgi:DNA repair exonuclease SbcCD nuclease subunit
MKPYLRIIGDIHGRDKKHIRFASPATYSIQVGDLNFRYDSLARLDPAFHKVIAGNHDNYTVQDGKFVKQTPHFLGDYGIHKIDGITDIFFVRGGRSIDKEDRTEGRDWWPDEQLNYHTACAALDLYKELKPDVVISHECPEQIIDSVVSFNTYRGEILRPSMTAVLLGMMFEYHQPKHWFFGHFHVSWNGNVNGTNFRCLNGALPVDTDDGKRYYTDPEYVDFERGEL